MDKLRYVGLDVHKERIVIAVSEKGASEAVVLGTFPQEVPKVIRGGQHDRHRSTQRGSHPSRAPSPSPRDNDQTTKLRAHQRGW